MIWAVEKWRPYQEGRPFEVITDQSELTGVSTSKAVLKADPMDHQAASF